MGEKKEAKGISLGAGILISILIILVFIVCGIGFYIFGLRAGENRTVTAQSQSELLDLKIKQRAKLSEQIRNQKAQN